MKKNNDFHSALRLSLPVMGAYLFLGTTYGLLAASMGYSVWFPLAMAIFIYSGSVEFVALTMMLGAFQPVAAFVIALMIGARHLFYGISMLERWSGAGRLKPMLIYWMSDETFAVNYSAGGSFRRQLWVSALDFTYWIAGAVAGVALGSFVSDSVLARLEGLDFVVTAMFTAILADCYIKNRESRPAALTGIVAAAAALAAFGSGRFIVPAMLIIVAALYVKYKRSERR